MKKKCPTPLRIRWNFPTGFMICHITRELFIQLVDAGFNSAIKENLDPEVLGETALLAGEMGSQLYNFANMLTQYLNTDEKEEG